MSRSGLSLFGGLCKKPHLVKLEIFSEPFYFIYPSKWIGTNPEYKESLSHLKESDLRKLLVETANEITFVTRQAGSGTLYAVCNILYSEGLDEIQEKYKFRSLKITLRNTELIREVGESSRSEKNDVCALVPGTVLEDYLHSYPEFEELIHWSEVIDFRRHFWGVARDNDLLEFLYKARAFADLYSKRLESRAGESRISLALSPSPEVSQIALYVATVESLIRTEGKVRKGIWRVAFSLLTILLAILALI